MTKNKDVELKIVQEEQTEQEKIKEILKKADLILTAIKNKRCKSKNA